MGILGKNITFIVIKVQHCDPYGEGLVPPPGLVSIIVFLVCNTNITLVNEILASKRSRGCSRIPTAGFDFSSYF